MENSTLVYTLFAIIVSLVLFVGYLFFKKNKETNSNNVSQSDSKTKQLDKVLLDQFYEEINELKKERENLKEQVLSLGKQEDLSFPNVDVVPVEKAKQLEKEKEDLIQKLEALQKQVVNSTVYKETNNETLEKEVKKLKTEIEDFEEEVEELEEEIRNLNVKLREEKQEIEELDSKIRVYEKTTEELKIEKESLLNGIQIEKEKVESKTNSLQFVNEILNAQEFSKVEDNENLTTLHFYLERVVLDYIKHYYPVEFINQLDNELWQWINLERKTWLKQKKVVAIVGEFSAGKTSLVNRVLSQDDPKAILLPVSSKETTAIPTYISNGIDFNCQVYSPSGALSSIKKEAFEMVTKSTLDDVKISNLIKYFVVSYKNKYLENITILDTPGFASNSSDIIKRTTDVVKESDAIFWVIDANTGDLNQSSLNVMKEHLHEIPLYLIINKADTKSPADLKSLEDKIKKTLLNNNLKVESIIRFSKNEDVKPLLGVIHQIPKKESSNVIDSLTETFEQIRMHLDEKYLAEKKENTMIKESIYSFENEFKVMHTNIQYFLKEIKSCIDYKQPFFGSDHYRIEEKIYGRFQNNLEKLDQTGEQFSLYIPKYKEEIKNGVATESNLKDFKYELKELNSIEKRFKELIKNYKEQ